MSRLNIDKTCADCGLSNPRWAVINLGIYVCSSCAGVHRKMGTHISVVKSVSLDRWQPDWLELMSKVGNSIAAKYYEANVPVHFLKIRADVHSSAGACGGEAAGGNAGDPTAELKREKWIRAKYELKLFLPRGEQVDGIEERVQPSRPIDGRASYQGSFPEYANLRASEDFRLAGFDFENNIFLKNWAEIQKKH